MAAHIRAEVQSHRMTAYLQLKLQWQGALALGITFFLGLGKVRSHPDPKRN